LPDELRLIAAFAVALGATAMCVPVAIRIARRTRFLDVPAGYKEHAEPTPYLGGLALMAGFGLAFSLAARDGDVIAPVLAGALALAVIGTVDDRIAVRPLIRLAAELGVAAVLYWTGLGWSGLGSDAANFLLTLVFVVGVVNAYNLMDNLDGAAASVGGASAACLAVIAGVEGEIAVAAMAAALAGACGGFLPANLARPARIFLGDGGSMPLGLVVAVAIMALPEASGSGWAAIPLATVFVGLPALDTLLVVVSRLRRGAPVYRGARDHLTHRLVARLHSPRRVALLLAVAQAGVSLLAIWLYEAGGDLLTVGALACTAIGVLAVAVLESPRLGGAAQASSA
jgi:UDP-GlcNAc:undecaprenyl-phosphate GlcNAc-1-phosphate transferase